MGGGGGGESRYFNGKVSTLEKFCYSALGKYLEKETCSGKIKDNEIYVSQIKIQKEIIFSRGSLDLAEFIQSKYTFGHYVSLIGYIRFHLFWKIKSFLDACSEFLPRFFAENGNVDLRVCNSPTCPIWKCPCKATIKRCDLSATILFKLVDSYLTTFKFA